MLAIQSTFSIESELNCDPNLSGATRTAYLSDLTQFELWKASQPFTRETVNLYSIYLKSRVSPSSINRKLSAIRWWAKRLLDLAYEGNLSREHLERVRTHAQRVIGVRGVKGDHKKAGQYVPDSQLKEMLAGASERDAALIVLAWATGLRRHEIVNLSLADISGDEITVLGKGDKVRIAYLPEQCKNYLSKWLEVRGDWEGPVFCRIGKGNRIIRESLSMEGMRHILNKYCQTISWHDFRRTFISNLLDKGVDLVTVQGMAGHSSANMTAKYDRRGERAKRAAASLMELDNAY